MDKETVAARLNTLKQERQMLLQQMAEAERRLVAYDGAIEDCEYWLEELDKEPKEMEVSNG